MIEHTNYIDILNQVLNKIIMSPKLASVEGDVCESTLESHIIRFGHFKLHNTIKIQISTKTNKIAILNQNISRNIIDAEFFAGNKINKAAEYAINEILNTKHE